VSFERSATRRQTRSRRPSPADTVVEGDPPPLVQHPTARTLVRVSARAEPSRTYRPSSVNEALFVIERPAWRAHYFAFAPASKVRHQRLGASNLF